MALQLKPGGEIEAYCTSCRTDKVHRIIALVGNTPKKVECLSCKGHHLYRATQAQKDAAAAHKRASKGDTSPAKPTARATRAGALLRAKQEDLSITWEKAITGKPFDQFKPYRVDRTFTKGELVRHAKFGEGVVTTILDAHKFEVLFKEGMKTLAQALQLSS